MTQRKSRVRGKPFAKAQWSVSYASVCAIVWVVGSARLIPAQSPITLRGSVRDSAGTPIPFVNVFLYGQRRTVSDTGGHFELRLTRLGKTGFEFRRLGFRPYSTDLNVSADTTIEVVLVPIALKLKGTVVQAERSRSLDIHGFYARMEEESKGIGRGWFITAEEIERRNPRRITQMLEGIPSVRVRKAWSCLGEDCMAPTGVNGCPMAVFLDNVRLFPPDALKTPERAFVTDLDEIAHPTTVAGIEVYARPTEAPPRFQMLNGTCGVILVWTK